MRYGNINGRSNSRLQTGKIYLLREYQRLGLGRLLIGHIARRFLSLGINSMSVFADAINPSCRFYELMGAEKSRHPNGKVNYGGYFWRDLSKLVSICIPED